ncbi:hypothetical protein OK17_20470 [Gordonia sp. GN26]
MGLLRLRRGLCPRCGELVPVGEVWVQAALTSAVWVGPARVGSQGVAVVITTCSWRSKAAAIAT